ncbi:hypothetical protein [Polyangium mundeleinium]|uniref:PEGA domain-containing protein n=1 Tax=Polyangium mundeleinium TaxID=2995306 RepID=A0ABT5EVB1_9BACT|nr:hypothetical protein [Polyangium mundeleinium]MDC0745374.1 hypothetical protein [Polyangium mundeleinium]
MRGLLQTTTFVAAPLLAALVFGGVAHADEKDDKARAQKLFIDGRKAIEVGDKANGCAKMRESMGLFAVANTLFNVAQCDEGEGKIAAALEHWERGLALIEAQDPRAKVAKERINALAPRVPRLRIVVPLGQPVSAVVVDGTEFAPSALSAPLHVEPGAHVIVVRAEGRPDRKHELTLAEKERTEFVATPAAPGAPPPAVVPTATASATTSEVVPPPPPPSSSNFRRTAGFIVGGVGVAGLIAAGVTGGVLASRDATIDGQCKDAGNDKKTCSQGAMDLINGSGPLFVANGIAWGVGVVGVGVGLALVFTAPSGKAKDEAQSTAIVPFFVPGGGGASISGRF